MCDTFVVLPPETADGSVLLGKNSDREPNEAQLLDYHEPEFYGDSAKLKCTYLTIPQARETQGVLISRPFWMWGAEMGVNDAGVAIGNEAVFTREPAVRDGRLTGMDLLRLALERSATAEQALETLTELLAEFGQGGPCGFEDKKMVYHNSFLIADLKTAWVLETAGEYWVAKQVKDRYAISNGLTIGEEYDLSHPGVIDHAREKGWLKNNATFNFAKTYSEWFYTTFSGSRKRRTCALDSLTGEFTVRAAFNALRSHGANKYTPYKHLLMKSVCAHSGNSIARHAAQSTGSLVAHIRPENSMAWVTGTAAPCTGVFKPVWLSEPLLPESARHGAGTYSEDSLWWRHELLHRRTLGDFENRLNNYSEERDLLEQALIEASEEASPDFYVDLTRNAFVKAAQQEAHWLEKLTLLPPSKQGPGFWYKKYWARQNSKAGIPI